MKGAVFAVLCAVAVTRCAIVANENGCPVNSGLEKLVRHADCGKYYQCVHGNLLERSCAPGLHFSSASSTCDFPIAANCQNIELENLVADQSDPSQADAVCSTSLSGVTVAHELCDHYYSCRDGKPVSMKCSTDLVYSLESKTCDSASNVKCGNRILVISESAEINQSHNEDDSTGHGDPSQAPSICAAQGSEGVLVAHENCNRFYKCSFGLPVAMICPHNLLYEPSLERCEWPETVICGDRTISDDTDNEGSVWEGNGAGNDDPSQAPAICAAEGSDHSYVAHENCNQFYQCWAGHPVALNCPAGHLFNPNKDYCDFPYNVDCRDRVIPENFGIDSGNDNQGGNNDENGEDVDLVGNNYYDPSEATAICGAVDSSGVLVAHENCNQFYKCTFGLPVALSCPGDLLFDPSKDRCEWPETVDCRERVIPENDGNDNEGNVWDGNGAGNDDPSLAPVICAAEGSDHSYVAHENCNQFYQCWAGLPVALNCPANLYFNPKVDYCDFPQNVNCGARLIPV